MPISTLRRSLIFPLLALLLGCGDTGATTDASAHDAQAPRDASPVEGEAGLDGGAAEKDAAQGALDPHTSEDATADDYEGCSATLLETDFQPSPLAGPGIVDGGLSEGAYVLSTTYLPLLPTGQQQLDALMGPMMQDMQSREGLIAFSLGTSESCASARTLTVWSSEQSMYAFVGAPAHAAAMANLAQVTRGGNLATHFDGSAEDVTWESAVTHLAK